MDTTVGFTAGSGRCTVAPGRLGEPIEPRTDRGKRAHKAARPEQLAASAPARG